MIAFEKLRSYDCKILVSYARASVLFITQLKNVLSIFYSVSTTMRNLWTCYKLMTTNTLKNSDQFHRNGESGFRISQRI